MEKAWQCVRKSIVFGSLESQWKEREIKRAPFYYLLLIN